MPDFVAVASQMNTLLPTTDLTSAMLQLYSGSGGMTGTAAVAPTVSADAGGAAASKTPWLLILAAGAVAVFFLMRKRR